MFSLSAHPLCKHGQKIRWFALSFCASPILGAYLYKQGYTVPFIGCPIRNWTGVPCPTCGMIRSFSAIAKGDFSQAVAEHLFGPLLFAAFSVAAIHISLELLFNRRLRAFYLPLVSQHKFQLVALSIFFGYYVLRLFYFYRTPG